MHSPNSTASDAATRAPAGWSEPTAQFDEPRVQAVYAILCSDEMPPKGEHWEGFAARRIVDALASAPASAPLPLTDEQIEAVARTVQPITRSGHPTWEHGVIRAYEAVKARAQALHDGCCMPYEQAFELAISERGGVADTNALTDERIDAIASTVWADAFKDDEFELRANREFARLIARECLAAAPVADDRASLLRRVERVLVEFTACYAAEVTDAQGTIWLGDLLRDVRAALSGGSPEPDSGSEGEEEGARQ